jgi:predicted naringenin-chalcone synthase
MKNLLIKTYSYVTIVFFITGWLYEYGNISSPTVWFVMEELMKRGISSGEWCVMLAFGAGLSVHAFLLRKV